MEHGLASLWTVTEEEEQVSHTQQSVNVMWVMGEHAPEDPQGQARVDTGVKEMESQACHGQGEVISLSSQEAWG